jgi:hypothetical protein
MMPMVRVFNLFLSICFSICGVDAAELRLGDKTFVGVPAEFLSGRTTPGSHALAAPARQNEQLPAPERAQALYGDLYSIIAPTFPASPRIDPDGGTLSYVRLANMNVDFGSTFIIDVVGTPSARLYGSTAIRIPPLASLQFALPQLLQAAAAGPLAAGDENFSLYLYNPDRYTGYQHIIFNAGTGHLENMSLCTYRRAVDYTTLNQVLISIHTSAIGEYPAYVLIHNYFDRRLYYEITISDARSGRIAGTAYVYVEPNASFTVPFSWYEALIGWTPNAEESHANMIFAAVIDDEYHAFIGQMIHNRRQGGHVNMTQFCWM